MANSRMEEVQGGDKHSPLQNFLEPHAVLLFMPYWPEHTQSYVDARKKIRNIIVEWDTDVAVEKLRLS